MFHLIKQQMPHKLENLPPNWDDIEAEWQHNPLNCPCTILSENKTLTVVFTCVERSFNYDFWITVPAHPEGETNIPKQIDINKHQPLLVSLSEALNDYEDFPETPLELLLTSYNWRTTRFPILKIKPPQWPLLILLILI